MANHTSRKTIIHFQAELLECLRARAAAAGLSISTIVNDAVRIAVAEDLEDAAVFRARRAEPVLSLEELLRTLAPRPRSG